MVCRILRWRFVKGVVTHNIRTADACALVENAIHNSRRIAVSELQHG
jgi:hypothetical protein